ncbi:MAG: hypothetical protein AAFP84_22045, partial [Actinomycetota bacterium]
QRRGEVADDLDAASAAAHLAAPILTNHVLLRSIAESDEISATIERFLADHAASPSRLNEQDR